MDTPKTPMDNLLNVLSGLSAGHEKALKQGIYNAVALGLLCVICSAGYGLYIVLNPFLKPLTWALLCGAVLFPVKLSLTTIVQTWFAATEETKTPLLFSLLMVPTSIFDKISDSVGSFSHKYLQYILCSIISLMGVLSVYNYTPSILCSMINNLLWIFNGILSLLISACNIYVGTTFVIGYFFLLHWFWTPCNKNYFRYYSLCIWALISMCFANTLGSYPLIIFCILQIFYLIGFIYETVLALDDHETEHKSTSVMDLMRHAFNKTDNSKCEPKKMPVLMEDESVATDEVEASAKWTPRVDKSGGQSSKPFLKVTGRSLSMDFHSDKTINSHLTRKVKSSGNVSNNKISLADRYFLSKLRSELRMTLDFESEDTDSDKYMYIAMYACIGMILWKHKWIIMILMIPIAYYYLKRLSSYFGIGTMISSRVENVVRMINPWFQERHEALIPIPIRGLYRVSLIVDWKVTQILKSSVDTVATMAVIFALILFVISASIFITVQIYTEGVHLIRVSGEILNSTLINNPDIDWIPQQWENSVNSMLDNAYIYGRSAISDGIKKLVKDVEPVKADQMEKKFLELWDRLYQAWMMSNDKADLIGPSVDVNVAFSAWESLTDGFGKSPLYLFNMTTIQNFAKEHVGILLSVLDSVWSIVRGNMSVVLGILTELMYIVLLSGSALLNFTLSVVVFFTALFYLLSSSGKTYKPIDLITNTSPISFHRFAMALQESVIGVFTATFKLASFFGMWTWFSHNLFQVKIVYLPSFLAFLLGAVPFLDAYFACIPATIELWYNQGPLIAMVFFLFHFLPCNIVVTEFYKEIKGGGHPYLTGLSIAGGVFCLGIEGAIFGPLLLCCIMVAINLSRRYLQSPSEEAINSIKSQIDQMES
ncbi:hypothetical protein QAD02_005368 [Eretmocerus hayati]|uniref:Uncharacterized protein n=1 Tax=Eretmocerus hayati TaxID=131215 RepID=A0ACC2NSI7_9HYME|nr:hypothetical protein QAD02_005368 [Eretmocerus hayati]